MKFKINGKEYELDDGDIKLSFENPTGNKDVWVPATVINVKALQEFFDSNEKKKLLKEKEHFEKKLKEIESELKSLK